MRAYTPRYAPALVLAAGALIIATTLAPGSARAAPGAHASGAAPLARLSSMSTTTVTPGPTTAPPELSMTASYTGPCDFNVITVTLSIVNVSNVNTPADTTLVVNFVGANGVTLELASLSSTFSAPPPTLLNGGFNLQLGAIAAHTGGTITFVLKPSSLQTVPNWVVGTLTASVVEPPAPSGSGEVLSNVLTQSIIVTNYCPTPVPTNTAPPSATPTQTPVIVPATETPSATAVPPSATPTETTAPSSTPTQTPVPPSPTSVQVAAQVPASETPAVAPSATPAVAPSATPVVPPSATPAVQASATPAPSSTPSATPTATPSATSAPLGLAPPSATPTAVTRYQTVKRYKTITRTHYKTITRTHYKTVKRYRTVPRYTTIVRYKTLYRTVKRYKMVVRLHVVESVRTVVNHKTVLRPVVRTIYHTVIRHRTVTSVVYAVRVQGHPKTGRFAAPATAAATTPVSAPDAYLFIPRLGISWAPAWTRGYVADGYGGFTYDIVPRYGVTRFAYSAPFGMPGTTMVYGHDDINGSIFRYLASLRRGDRVTAAVGHHRFTYVVRTVSIVSPTNVSMLTAPRTHPTLALISCTPYWVDTHRVVVIADLAT